MLPWWNLLMGQCCIKYAISGGVQLDNTMDGIFWTKYQCKDAKYANNNVLENNPIAWTETTVPVRYKFDGNLNRKVQNEKKLNKISIFICICICRAICDFVWVIYDVWHAKLITGTSSPRIEKQKAPIKPMNGEIVGTATANSTAAVTSTVLKGNKVTMIIRI